MSKRMTYVQKDGETISVSSATHSNVYDVVCYLVTEKNLAQPIQWGTPEFNKAKAAIRKRRQREKDKQDAEDIGEPEQKKVRKVPRKFSKALTSCLITIPRFIETDPVSTLDNRCWTRLNPSPTWT